MTHESAYGLWSLVIINSLIFIMFAFSFFKSRSKRDWRSFSAFSAFIVALFVEMYGFPFTIYLLSGWLIRRFPNLDLFSHDAGHLWNTLLGWQIDPHFDPLHILSNIFIFGGFILIMDASALRGAEDAYAGNDRALCLHTSSPAPRRYFNHVRVFVAVADTYYFAHVSRSRHHVREARAPRRARSAGGAFGSDAWVHSMHRR